MKNTLLITSLLAVALALGCKPSVADPADKTSEKTTAQQVEKVEVATKDAAVQIKEYTFGQKTEFVMAMKEQLTALNQGMDELSVKIEKASEAVKAEAAPKFAALREKATQLTKQVDEISNATLPTWNVMKADTEKAYAELKDGIAQLRQAVSDKIAP